MRSHRNDPSCLLVITVQYDAPIPYEKNKINRLEFHNILQRFAGFIMSSLLHTILGPNLFDAPLRNFALTFRMFSHGFTSLFHDIQQISFVLFHI